MRVTTTAATAAASLSPGGVLEPLAYLSGATLAPGINCIHLPSSGACVLDGFEGDLGTINSGTLP